MPTKLPAELFRRFDESSDAQFYATPRLVAHIEPETIGAVTQLYRQMLPENGEILDLMSSWISHLPPEMSFARVAATGMNARELQANPRLRDFVVHDLNAHPQLPFEDAAFDAALCCVSVQYLTRPVEVFAGVSRVCRAGAPLDNHFFQSLFPDQSRRRVATVGRSRPYGIGVPLSRIGGRLGKYRSARLHALIRRASRCWP